MRGPQDEDSEVVRDTLSTLELLDRLADRVLRTERAGAALTPGPSSSLTPGPPGEGRETASPASPLVTPPFSSVWEREEAAVKDEAEISGRDMGRHHAPLSRGSGCEAGRDTPATIPPAPAAPPADALDAEAVADLVNEALVEQARRHGVDLS